MKHIKTQAEFEALIKENNNVVIDFYATWCGPCKMLAPIFEQVSAEKENVTFVKVDVDEAGELANLFGITSIPTVVYIKNEKMALRELGFKPKAAILENIKTIFEESIKKPLDCLVVFLFRVYSSLISHDHRA